MTDPFEVIAGIDLNRVPTPYERAYHRNYEYFLLAGYLSAYYQGCTCRPTADKTATPTVAAPNTVPLSE